MTNYVAILEVKIKYKPTEPVGPPILIPAKKYVDDLFIHHASLAYGQREEEQLPRINTIASLMAVGPVAGANLQIHLIVG
jgi:hypothetical protein